MRESAGHLFPLMLIAAGLSMSAISAQASVSPSLAFERNAGQSDSRARYVARGAGYTVAVGDDGVAIRTIARQPGAEAPSGIRGSDAGLSDLVKIRLSGSASDAHFTEGAVVAGVVNYLRGSEPAGWVRGVARLDSIRQVQVYDGIDLVYRANNGNLQYDFVLSPGADPSQIELVFEGANAVTLDSAGNLRIETGTGMLIHKAPVLYQQLSGGKKFVSGAAILDGMRLRFAVGDYDPRAALVIDPTLVFGSYLGGSASDAGSDVVTDAAGDMFVTGAGASLDFPAPGGTVTAPAGQDDAFVAKFSRASGELVFVTYIGGTLEDRANVIELDAAGNIYVAGYTRSPDFPAVNAAQPAYAGGDAVPGSLFDAMDGFVLRLQPDGAALDYSTFLGGSAAPVSKFGFEWLRGLHVSAAGEATVFGETVAADFPASDRIDGRPCLQGDASAASSIVSDIIVARYAPDGVRQFATCLGGSARDAGRGGTVDADGSIVVAGFSRSADLPTSVDAFQNALASADGFSYDGYVARLNSTATAVDAATYIGGTHVDFLQRVLADSAGRLVLVGSSLSADYPITPNAVQTDFRGVEQQIGDSVLSVLSANMSGLDYSTYFGGSGDESGWALARDSGGRVVFAGTTTSRDFPVVEPIMPQAAEWFAPGENIGAAGGGPESVAAGDLDGDGRADLVVGQNGGAPLLLYINNGTRNPYADVVPQALGPAADNTRRVLVTDMNNDGFNDIATANQGGTNRIYINNGTVDPFGGVMPGAIGSSADMTWSLTIADADRNGLPDIFAANSDNRSHLYLNNGTSAPFAGVVGTPVGDAGLVTRAIGVGDINGDGWPDAILANDGQNYWLASNGSAAPFDGSASLPVGGEADDTWGVAVFDADQNGTIDVAFGNGGSVAATDLLFLGNGSAGAMAGVTGLPLGAGDAGTFELLAADVDGNGQTDLLAAHSAAGNQPNRLLRNDGGVFESLDIGTDVDSSQGLTLGDIDGDSDDDVVVANAVGHAVKSYAGNASSDLFLGVLAADFSGVEFATTLGGSGADFMVWGLHVDAMDNAWLTGHVASWDAPVPGGPQTTTNFGEDAWLVQVSLSATDADGDGVDDADDNCTLVANPDQRDSNGDGFGNRCDADLNNDGVVNFVDLARMRASFFLSTGDVGFDEDADLDGDGSVNFIDLGTMKNTFFGAPGPSGRVSRSRRGNGGPFLQPVQSVLPSADTSSTP